MPFSPLSLFLPIFSFDAAIFIFAIAFAADFA